MVDHTWLATPGGPVLTSALRVGGGLVAREDQVERALGVREDLPRLLDLRLVAGTQDLARCDSDILDQTAELAHLVTHVLAERLPRRAELLPVLLDVRPALVG